MVIIKGRVVQGCGNFEKRLTRPDFRAAYRKATGEELCKGTLNVEVNKCIPVKEHFRIQSTEYDDPVHGPKQDLLFEICQINGLWAYRIRPYVLCTGAGGWGDHIIEIGCSQEIPDVPVGKEVQIALFRDDIEST